MTLSEYYPRYFGDYCQQFSKKYTQQLSPIDVEHHLTQVFLKFNELEKHKKTPAYLWTMCSNKFDEILRKPTYVYDIDKMVNFLITSNTPQAASMALKFTTDTPDEPSQARWAAYNKTWDVLCADCHTVLQEHWIKGLQLKDLWQQLNFPSYEALQKKHQRCFAEFKEITHRFLENPLAQISKSKRCQ